MPEPAAETDIDLPAGWRQRSGDAASLLVAQAAEWSSSFVPTLTLVTTRTPGCPRLRDYVDIQVAGLGSTVEGHLVHLTAGHRPHPHLDLVLAIEHGGIDLTVVQRHAVNSSGDDETRAVVATGMVADVEWPAMAGAVVAAVRSLRVAWR